MKAPLLKLLRVSEMPDPPPGSGSTLRTFRASRRFLYYLGIEWAFKQIGALLGIVFSLAFLSGALPFVSFGGLERLLESWEQASIDLGFFAVEFPLVDLLNLFEIFAILGFLVQFVLSAMLLKLGWEMRWYMVSDESLRIREGLVSVREQTMTVANIQNMSVRQGPIQKLFGIADLEVHTAGGGGSSEAGESSGGGKQLHRGRFRGLENAPQVRDRIRASLVRHRNAGLGDPDESDDDVDEGAVGAVPEEGAGGRSRLAAASLRLAQEARELRRAVASASGAGRERSPDARAT